MFLYNYRLYYLRCDMLIVIGIVITIIKYYIKPEMIVSF
jgi:hypothetical protein